MSSRVTKKDVNRDSDKPSSSALKLYHLILPLNLLACFTDSPSQNCLILGQWEVVKIELGSPDEYRVYRIQV